MQSLEVTVNLASSYDLTQVVRDSVAILTLVERMEFQGDDISCLRFIVKELDLAFRHKHFRQRVIANSSEVDFA